MTWRAASVTLMVMATKSLLLTEFGGSVSADVDAPADEVFSLLTDTGRLPEWTLGFVACPRHVAGPVLGGGRSGAWPTPCLAEQYGGDGRARQTAAADDHEGRARGGGIEYRATDEVADGRCDAHPAVDVSEDTPEQLGR